MTLQQAISALFYLAALLCVVWAFKHLIFPPPDYRSLSTVSSYDNPVLLRIINQVKEGTQVLVIADNYWGHEMVEAICAPHRVTTAFISKTSTSLHLPEKDIVFVPSALVLKHGSNTTRRVHVFCMGSRRKIEKLKAKLPNRKSFEIAKERLL